MIGTVVIIIIFCSGYAIGFECQGRYCLFGREVCVHSITEYGQLQSNCEAIKDVYNFLNDCSTNPTYKIGCYCSTENCNLKVYTDYHSWKGHDSQTSCYDKEGTINCEEADRMYNLCSAPSSALRALAFRVCRKFCGLCSSEPLREVNLPETMMSNDEPDPIDDIIRARRPTFRQCNKVAVLTDFGLGKRTYHKGARQCPFSSYQKSDAVILGYCEAPEISLWTQEVKVSEVCSLLPTYSPIAQYHKNQITDTAGILVRCFAHGEFMMILQNCDKDLHIVNVTWPVTDTFYTVNWDNIQTTVPPTTSTTLPTPTQRSTTSTILPTPTQRLTTTAPTQTQTQSPQATTLTPVVTQTPSTTEAGCRDLKGVDCALLQSSVNICSLPTALRYCPLYCGLCPSTTPQVNPGQGFGR